jgi:4-phosphopantoate--beta-alanine ligase
MTIPKSHPRYRSLLARERLVAAYRDGVVVPEGLIAHGRGEAFDYLLGEETIPPARDAARAAAAHLLRAKRPVLSVNGNVAALAAEACVQLARAVPARLEVNLFYRTEGRVARIADALRAAGATEVLGEEADARIPGLGSERGKCAREGIFSADVVLVALEDGDRAEALVRMGKTVLAVDLNPLSRTAQAAHVAIVDEVARALPVVAAFVDDLRDDAAAQENVVASFDSAANLAATLSHLERRLRTLAAGTSQDP